VRSLSYAHATLATSSNRPAARRARKRARPTLAVVGRGRMNCPQISKLGNETKHRTCLAAFRREAVRAATTAAAAGAVRTAGAAWAVGAAAAPGVAAAAIAGGAEDAVILKLVHTLCTK